MQLQFTREEELFREEVREWLHSNVPSESRPIEAVEAREFDLAWQRTQYEGGYAGIAWPKEYGGQGLSLARQLIWYEEYARASAPHVGTCFVGNNHGGPTLIVEGNEEQKAFHLPKIIQGDVVWCQGFSEPSAGSDLAGLRTRAVIDGDHLVVNGQKVWTSYADAAEYQELLVRTDPDAPKHKGITWVICDMKTPGITIRPIRTIDGCSEFCEVFYEDVRIPLSNVVGEINDGWRVAMSTLSFERGTAFMADQVELSEKINRLIQLAQKTKNINGRAFIDDDHIAHRLAHIKAQIISLGAMTYAAVSRNMTQDMPGPEGSMLRLYYSEVLQDLHTLAMEILQGGALELKPGAGSWGRDYLYSLSQSIGGGTSEIQRNIIAQRCLGMPRSR